jgi:hypothetical protein
MFRHIIAILSGAITKLLLKSVEGIQSFVQDKNA